MTDKKTALAALSSQGIRERSSSLTAEGMKAYIEAKIGARITWADFRALMYKKLPLENYYQTKIIEYLAHTYPEGMVWKAAAGPYSQGGIPDVHFLLDGHFYAFEVKRPYIGEATPLQKKRIDQINRAGGSAAVVCLPKDCEAIIRAERNHQQRH